MPYKIAFIEVTPESDWFIVDIVIDILFFLDVCVNLFSAYYDNEGVLVTGRKKIFCHYLKTWMIPDLLACFPFNLLESDDQSSQQSSGSSGGYNNMIRLIRLPRLYRLVRISRIFKMMKMKQDSEFMEKL
jgi:hypothetical protein